MTAARMRLLFIFCHFVVFCGSCLIQARVTEKDELVLLQVVFRHGDRSPTRSYPTDAHADAWSKGYGQLINKGIWRAYNLGKYFKKTYIDDLKFLPSVFNTDDVAIRSSGYDRTIMTAQSAMTAMYPPQAVQSKWNPEDPEFPWQPIPIHSVPKKDDLILKYGNDCPRYQQLKYQVVIDDNPAFKAFIEQNDHKKVMDLAKKEAGLTYPYFMLYQLYDTLLVQQQNNMTLPSWVDAKVMEVLERLTVLDYHLLTSTPEMARLAGGNLLKELFQNIQHKIHSDENGEKSKKAFFYSAHDSTIMALLGALDIDYDALPEYNAFVAMELYRSQNGTYKIKTLYRTDPNIYPENPQTLHLPACPGEQFCLFDRALQYYESKRLVVKDYNQECEAQNK